jgi:predicted nuclease of predicted toxin-antitoxin system
VKRILFDENMPRQLKRHLPDFIVRTVQEVGWGSARNGELLRRAEGNFDVLVTADRRMEYQQNLTGYAIAVVVLVTPRLRWQLLETASERLRAALSTVAPGEVVRIDV